MPSVEQEAARDLVRAREDVRGDLMRARHRVSKLLLRQRDRLLRRAGRGPASTTVAAVASGSTSRAGSWRSTPAYETMLHDRGPPGPAGCRRSIEMAERQRATPTGGAPAGLPARHLDVDRVRAGGGDRRLAPVHRFHASARSSGWCRPSTPRASPGRRARSPRPATATPAGCWSRPPGTTPRPTAMPGKTMRDRWELAPAAARARGHEGNRRLHQRWQAFNARKKRPSSPTSPSPASSPAGPGRWPCSSSAGHQDFSARHRHLVAARGTIRDTAMNNRP